MKYKPKSNEMRKAEVDDLIKKLQSGVQEYVESDRYKELLDNMTKFHDYSINNTISIILQKPDATLVASYSKWKSLNRQVKSGEKGIAILCPVRFKIMKEIPVMDEAGEIQTDLNGQTVKKQEYQQCMSYKIGYVFDKSQTEQIKGKKEYVLEPVSELDNEYGEHYEDMVRAIESISAVPITFEKITSGAKGYYDDEKNKIVINEGMSESQTLKTMIHELTHARLHGSHWDRDYVKISFDFRECIEFPNLGEVDENITLEDAIEKVGRSAHSKMLPGIVFRLHDGSIYDDMEYPLVIGDTVQVSSINDIEYFRENYEIQKAIQKASIFYKNDMALRSTKEVQAESIAYICSKHFGLDTSDYSFGYIATWGKDNQQLLDSLNIIKTTSEKMITDIEKKLEQTLLMKNHIESEEDMAMMIDGFMKDFDPYGYSDTEEYEGFNFESILAAVKSNDTTFIEKSLKDVIEENMDGEMAQRAKEVLSCIEAFKKKTMDIADELVLKRGIEMI